MRQDPCGNPLPPRLHFKHGRYWYVRKNKWVQLSKQYYKALQQLSAKESPTDDWSKLVELVYSRYEKRYSEGKLAKSTIEQYRGVRSRIEYGFSEFSPEQVETSDITAFLDLYEDTPNMANRMLTVIKAIFERAVRQGVCKANPAYSVKRFDEAKRDRYLTDEEYKSIRAAANSTTQCIMDMCYLTAQRISDVLAIKHSDISEDGIYFQQKKSKGDQAGSRLLIESTTELSELVAQAKKLHKVERLSHYLFHPLGKATAYQYSSIRDNFNRARDKAGVEDATIHDLRAKSITDAKREGLDPQALAGHKSPMMTERYIRLRETATVKGPKIRHLKGKP